VNYNKNQIVVKKTFIFFGFYFLIKIRASAQQTDRKPVGIIPDSFKSSWRGTFIPSALKREKKVISLNDISASIKNLDEQPFETDLEEVKRLKEALEKEKGVFTPLEIVEPRISSVNNKVYTVRKMKIINRSSKSRKKKRPCNCR
jgi:hypothetical protein